MSFTIEGKTAIVTGAANGIGLAVARHFQDKGANVMFADMDEAQLEKELGKGCDEGSARYFAGDLRERLTQANLLSATLDAFDRVDILVNASRQVLSTDPLSLDDTSVEDMLTQNMMTALRMSQTVAKRMIKQAGDQEEGNIGSIVNLSSIAARRTRPDLMGYSISSAAMDQMTRSMAAALAHKRIRVNAIAIGSVMSASLKLALKDNPSYREDIRSHTPLDRIASPDEVAEATQFLCCDAAGFVTGQVLTLDGGRTLLDPVTAPTH